MTHPWFLVRFWLATAAGPAPTQACAMAQAPAAPVTAEVVAFYEAVRSEADGVKLDTVILMKKDAKGAPILPVAAD